MFKIIVLIACFHSAFTRPQEHLTSIPGLILEHSTFDKIGENFEILINDGVDEFNNQKDHIEGLIVQGTFGDLKSSYKAE